MVYLLEMEEYAKINNIPIMQKDGIDFLTQYIKEHNIKSILEIGSAIGYSAIKMALVDSDITVTTVERDEIRYNEAIKNIKHFDLENRINVIFENAVATAERTTTNENVIAALELIPLVEDTITRDGYTSLNNLGASSIPAS